MTRLAPDLLDHEVVHDKYDLLGWYPRASHTRTQARHRFWRELHSAEWEVPWVAIRTVLRYLKQNPYDPEGYVECPKTDEGATPVWRCETVRTRADRLANYY